LNKLLAFLLAVVMAVGMSACAAEALQASTAGAIAPEQTEEPDPSPGLAPDLESVCSQANAEEMLRACGQLAAYLAVSVYEIDMTSPDPEDFWLILSLVTYAAYPEFLSEFGTIDLTEEQLADLAETFLPEWVAQNGLPSTKGSYVAEYVAAEALYELQPMAISDMSYELVSLDPIGSSDGGFLMGIRLSDEKGRTEKLEWLISFRKWDDGREHIFPCSFQGIWDAAKPAG